MTDKFKNKYRIPSARLQTWDYGSNGAYFITICTLNREHFFGEIVEGEIHLNEIGKMAEQEWIKTSEFRPDMNLELDAFVVMPNHIHGIIIIGENRYNSNRDIIRDPIRRDAMHCVSTTPSTPVNQFRPQSKNLASIIRGIKSSVTTQAKKFGYNDFAWQSRFHDHIIHDAAEMDRIRNYIANNPANWKEDKFYEK